MWFKQKKGEWQVPDENSSFKIQLIISLIYSDLNGNKYPVILLQVKL